MKDMSLRTDFSRAWVWAGRVALTCVGVAASACLPSEYWVGGETMATSDPGPALHCSNGVVDPGEVDVDCGPVCGPCEDGQRCTADDECASGRCSAGTCKVDLCAAAEPCPPAEDPCRVRTCDPALGCVDGLAEPGAPCADPMLGPGTCSGGLCLHSCGDCSSVDNECRVGVCELLSGACAVQWVPEGTPCFGGCMNPGKCAEGVCYLSQEELTLFSSDFADGAGWTIEGVWEIGPAKPSFCSFGAPDPAEDHSPSADEFLAGTVIGGCLPPDPLPFMCLTSPPIDLGPALGAVRLRYAEVQSSGQPAVIATVEVLAEKGWMTVAIDEGDPQPIPKWIEREVMLPIGGAPVLQVRFCITSMGSMDPASGWSIDDVSVVTDGC